MNYHEDKETRIANERHAGIVVKDSKVLMIRRIRKNFEYYVFPGGHRRMEEIPEDTVIREIAEETSIVVSSPKLTIKKFDEESGRYDFYYLCQWVFGDSPKISGEEKERNCQKNLFEPMWIAIEEAKELNILPPFAKEWLLKNL